MLLLSGSVDEIGKDLKEIKKIGVVTQYSIIIDHQ